MDLLRKGVTVLVRKGPLDFLREVRRFVYARRIKGTEMLDTCAICGSDSIDLFLRERPSSLYRCDKCGLIFYNPLPSKDALRKYYSSEEGYLPSIRETARAHRENYVNHEKRYKGFIDRILKGTDNHRRILDIGCGYGFFLSYCRERGFEPFGIEVSEQTSTWARAQGLNVFTGTIHEAPFHEGFFDVVTSFHCLEHALDPKAEILKISSLCKKGGLFLLAIPNAGSLVAEYSFAAWKWKSWPNHLFYFSPENLRILLNKAGFKIVEIYSQAGDSDFNDDRRLLAKQASMKNEDEEAVLDQLYNSNKGQELVVLSENK